MEDNYLKAYKEVTEILKYVPKESVEKIPFEIRKMFETKMDAKYDFKVDINKNFQEQVLLDETKAILANIFRDYWATPYQKERIKAKEQYDRKKTEEEKKEKYDFEEIFKKRKIENISLESESIDNKLPIEIKKESFYKKIFSLFKRIFHIK